MKSSTVTKATALYEKITVRVRGLLRGDDLRASVLRGGAWLASGNVAEQASRFARNLILVRLLAPSAFGTMAIVLSACSLLQSCSDIGVRDALIQHPKGEKPEYIGAAWWMAFGRAVAIYVVVFIIAPLVARFYENPELKWLLRVALLTAVFEGAMSSRAYVALKQMKFRKWAFINHGGAICGIVATIALSIFFRNVWALVLGSCAEGAARFTLSYVVCPFIPPAGWDRQALRDLVKFSRGQFGLSFLNLVCLRTDIFVLAKLFSAPQLGIYTMGVYVAQVPTGFAMMLLGNLLIPTFSKIQGDETRTNDIVINLVRVMILSGVPAVAFVFFAARPLLGLIYGNLYLAGAGPFFLASVVGLINLVNAPATGVFYANGHPQLHRRCVAAMAILMILTVYPTVKIFGLIGGQIACLIAISVGFWFQLVRLRELTRLKLRCYGRFVLVSLAAAVFVTLVSVLRWASVTSGLTMILIPLTALLVTYAALVIKYLPRSVPASTVVSNAQPDLEDDLVSESATGMSITG